MKDFFKELADFFGEAADAIKKTIEKHETCRWKLVDRKDGEWHTECKQTLNLPDDLIEKCDFTKCPYCGKEMLVIGTDENDEEDDEE